MLRRGNGFGLSGLLLAFVPGGGLMAGLASEAGVLQLAGAAGVAKLLLLEKGACTLLD